MREAPAHHRHPQDRGRSSRPGRDRCRRHHRKRMTGIVLAMTMRPSRSHGPRMFSTPGATFRRTLSTEVSCARVIREGPMMKGRARRRSWGAEMPLCGDASRSAGVRGAVPHSGRHGARRAATGERRGMCRGGGARAAWSAGRGPHRVTGAVASMRVERSVSSVKGRPPAAASRRSRTPRRWPRRRSRPAWIARPRRQGRPPGRRYLRTRMSVVTRPARPVKMPMVCAACPGTRRPTSSASPLCRFSWSGDWPLPKAACTAVAS